MKKVLAIMLVLATLLSVCGALAATGADGRYYDTETLEGLPPFKFQHFEDGIWCGTCPVYSAPYKDAYRANDGRASCATDGHLVDVGGYNSDGWLLVRYETNGGSWRVGWIPPKYVKGRVRTSMNFHFGRIRQVADDDISVTENNKNPNNPRSYIGTIEEGDTYYVLGYYNYTGYELWYVEFDLDGQTAWGFIERD